jgi:hypothetical protein
MGLKANYYFFKKFQGVTVEGNSVVTEGGGRLTSRIVTIVLKKVQQGAMFTCSLNSTLDSNGTKFGCWDCS